MQETARKEISNTVSDVEDLSMEELNDLLYVDVFIKESLRLFLPVPQDLRVATTIVNLVMYQFRKGQHC